MAGQPIRDRFLDGVAERLPLGPPRAPVRAAWRIAAAGANVRLGLYSASQEDAASARECLRDLKARGMNTPVLIATDRAPGLIRAVEAGFPQSLRPRGLAHQLRNPGAKVPEERGREVKAHALAAYQALSPRAVHATAEEFWRRTAREFRGAVAGFEDDFEACIAHLRLPITHRQAIRTTSLLERLLGEERRRTKTLPHASGERAVLKRMFVALACASQSWRRLVISEFELRQIEKLKTELPTEFQQRTSPALPTASRIRFFQQQ